MHTIDKYFPVFYPQVGFLDAAFAHTKGLHFRSMQRDARLILILDKVVKISLLIIGYQFDIFPHLFFNLHEGKVNCPQQLIRLHYFNLDLLP